MLDQLNMYLKVILIFSLFMVWSLPLPAQAPATPEQSLYEHPPVFAPNEVLPAQLLEGPNHRVIGRASAEGYCFTFEIWSRFGRYKALSLDMLKVRIQEINALAVCEQLEKDPQFLTGLTTYLEDTSAGLEEAATNPLQAIANIPLGLGKFFESVQAAVQYEPGGRTAPETYGGLINSAEKRRLAMQLQVDPDTDNELLQSHLNDIATNRAFGRLMTELGTMAIPGVPGLIVGAVDINTSARNMLLDMSPEQLQQANAEKLLKLGSSAHIVRAFLTHENYSPVVQTVITANLEALKDVAGVVRFLETALDAPNPDATLFHLRTIEMIQAFHAKIRPLKRMDIAFATPVLTDGQGGLILLQPIDYLYWDKTADETAKTFAVEHPNTPLELWVTGRVSPMAAKKLASYHIKVVEQAGAQLWEPAKTSSAVPANGP